MSTELLSELGKGVKRLQELNDKQLEEIVVELLRKAGLLVNIIKRTYDDGKDIIAKREFLPGYESTPAIEIMKTHKYDIENLSQAIYENRIYPAILIATSGKFSSRVIQEQKLPENRYRLILRDGDQIIMWIQKEIRK